jgi:hypothetical protein
MKRRIRAAVAVTGARWDGQRRAASERRQTLDALRERLLERTINNLLATIERGSG